MMMQSSVDKMNANALSLVFHGALIGLTAMGANLNFQWPWMAQGDCSTPVVEAVMVDENQVMQELAQIRERDAQRDVAREQLTAAQQELEDIAEAKSELELELAKLQRDRDRMNLATKNAEQQLEAERRKLAEQQRLQDREEAARRARERELEAQRTQERQEQERLERERIAREQAEKQRQAERAAQRRQQMASIVASAQNAIKRKIEDRWIVIPGLPSGLSCELSIRTVPGGDVISVRINRSSGNDAFDQSAISAAYAASPLPVPADLATFEDGGFRSLVITFHPPY